MSAGEARALNNIAVVYRRIGEMQQALAHYRAALEILAKAERLRGDRDRALRYARGAIAIVESQRLRVSARGLRATFLASQHGSYELAVDLLMELHAERPADR